MSKKKFFICGVDEAGRGPLAGPVVAAAVIIGNNIISGVKDSKLLSPKRRLELAFIIKEKALSFSYGIVSEKKIDKLNIYYASLLAMKKAVLNLTLKPDFVMVDGFLISDISFPQRSLKKGDKLCYHISCASILAKVERDRIMEEYEGIYPGYEFKKHKGYPTKRHFELIKKLGPSPIHRKSFAPVKFLSK
jgi:ribonuclease HII